MGTLVTKTCWLHQTRGDLATDLESKAGAGQEGDSCFHRCHFLLI